MKNTTEETVIYALYVKNYSTDDYIRVATNKDVEVLLNFINENGDLGTVYQIEQIVITYSENIYTELLTFKLNQDVTKEF